MSIPSVQAGDSDEGVATPTEVELEEIYGTVQEAPIFLGGNEGGETAQSAYIEGIGEVWATINNETGIITTTYPDGRVEEITAGEVAVQLHALSTESQPVDLDGILLQANLDPFEICPYVVSIIGTGGTLSLGAVLAAIGINPLAGVLLTLGQAGFMTWVANNC
ncbi:hypothetical protein [Corynebacterium maris]|uniref:hypothetical protein n=1 Tax=Corynebacterium maris TaxID=575200 RepID=UPI0012EC9F13|nr:hypothetical protein [Corynebacterium maris]